MVLPGPFLLPRWHDQTVFCLREKNWMATPAAQELQRPVETQSYLSRQDQATCTARALGHHISNSIAGTCTGRHIFDIEFTSPSRGPTARNTKTSEHIFDIDFAGPSRGPAARNTKTSEQFLS